MEEAETEQPGHLNAAQNWIWGSLEKKLWSPFRRPGSRQMLINIFIVRARVCHKSWLILFALSRLDSFAALFPSCTLKPGKSAE